jgi:AbrB family looped-hinge helix DNA binding protein
MTTTILTTKGQIVIPSKIRKRLNLKEGTKFSIVEDENRIVLQPLTPDYFEKMAGILNTKGKLVKALMEERRQEKEREDKR